MSKMRLRIGVVVTLGGGLAGLTGCTSPPSVEQYVDQLYSAPTIESPADSECVELFVGGLPEGVTLVSAKNEEIALAARLLSSMGVSAQDDPNIAVNDGDTPISMCAFSDPSRVLQFPGAEIVLYKVQGENGTGIAYYR